MDAVNLPPQDPVCVPAPLYGQIAAGPQNLTERIIEDTWALPVGDTWDLPKELVGEGPTAWLRDSACSASTPRRHPLSTHRKHQARPEPWISAQIQLPYATNPQVSMMYSPRAHNREPTQVADDRGVLR